MLTVMDSKDPESSKMYFKETFVICKFSLLCGYPIQKDVSNHYKTKEIEIACHIAYPPTEPVYFAVICRICQ